jgi:hypothetical protein
MTMNTCLGQDGCEVRDAMGYDRPFVQKACFFLARVMVIHRHLWTSTMCIMSYYSSKIYRVQNIFKMIDEVEFLT